MKNLLRLTWLYAGDGKPRMILFYAMFIVANALLATQPLILAHLVDGLKETGPTLWRELASWSLLLWLLMLIFWGLHGPARVIERRVAFGVYERYVRRLYSQVMALPLGWHQAHHSGDTIGRISKASKALFQFAETQFMLIEIAVRYTASLALLAWFCWWLALLVVALSLVILVVVRRMDRHLVAMLRLSNEKEHRIGAALYDFIGNVLSVMTLRLGERTKTELADRFTAMRGPYDEQAVYNEKKWFSLSMGVSLMRAALLALYIVVSLHRLRLLPRFDRAIVMEDGRIVEQGRVADLLQAEGPLQTLWQRHLGQKRETKFPEIPY